MKTTELTNLLRQLVTVRRKKRITQAQVATEMNTTASAIARLESGGGKKHHFPTLSTLNKYAAASR